MTKFSAKNYNNGTHTRIDAVDETFKELINQKEHLKGTRCFSGTLDEKQFVYYKTPNDGKLSSID